LHSTSSLTRRSSGTPQKRGAPQLCVRRQMHPTPTLHASRNFGGHSSAMDPASTTRRRRRADLGRHLDSSSRPKCQDRLATTWRTGYSRLACAAASVGTHCTIDDPSEGSLRHNWWGRFNSGWSPEHCRKDPRVAITEEAHAPHVASVEAQ
jgi:hypothetical protein